MTSKRTNTIQDLRSRITDLDPNNTFADSYLSRWLKARYWIISDAEAMLRDHINWRRENEVDSILENHKKSEFISSYFPGGFCGKDRQNRPVFIAPCGQFDTYNFIKCVSRPMFVRDRIFVLEDIMQNILPRSSLEAQHPVEQLCVIVDLQGLNRSHVSVAWLGYVRDVVCMLEMNYPEILGTCYIVNAPYLFNILLTFLRALLSKATQQKIHVLKSDYKTTLLEHIDPNFLPQFYGGSMVDSNGDPKCSSLICWGGPIPQSCLCKFSFQVETENVPAIPNNLSSVVNISRGALQDILIGALNDGASLIWTLSCESCDIGVGLVCKMVSTDHPELDTEALDRLAEDGDLSELIPVQRFAKNACPIQGSFRIPFTAVYYLRLDNSFSWVRSKRVRYAFRIE